MKKLVIVQHKPTQFDAPFYARIAQRKNFDLHVFYTAAFDDPLKQIDPEIGIVTGWDNLTSHTHPSTHLSAQQASNRKKKGYGSGCAPITRCVIVVSVASKDGSSASFFLS